MTITLQKNYREDTKTKFRRLHLTIPAWFDDQCCVTHNLPKAVDGILSSLHMTELALVWNELWATAVNVIYYLPI